MAKINCDLLFLLVISTAIINSPETLDHALTVEGIKELELEAHLGDELRQLLVAYRHLQPASRLGLCIDFWKRMTQPMVSSSSPASSLLVPLQWYQELRLALHNGAELSSRAQTCEALGNCDSAAEQLTFCLRELNHAVKMITEMQDVLGRQARRRGNL